VPGFGELGLSASHSYMPHYKCDSTCVKYERGDRLLHSAPEVQRLLREGLYSLEDETDRARVAIGAALEKDLGCKLQAEKDKVYVDPQSLSPTAVKNMIYGGRVGYAIRQALGIYEHANPFVQDQAPAHVRRVAHGTLSAEDGRDRLREILDRAPGYFIIVGDRWPSGGRVVTVPMVEVYRAALTAGWSARDLAIVRKLIESGARLSEVLALTPLDAIRSSDFGTRSWAINKGSRGTVWKVIGYSPECAAQDIEYINEHRSYGPELRRYGRRLTVDDFRQLYEDGRHDELRVPLYPSSKHGFLTRDGWYNGRFAPTMSPLGVRGHDPRHAFVGRNLDLIYGMYWDKEVLLKDALEHLLDYMSWSTRELMLFIYSRRHRQQRNALLSAAFHNVISADVAGAALRPGITPIPTACSANPIGNRFAVFMGTAPREIAL
jgi:integrase